MQTRWHDFPQTTRRAAGDTLQKSALQVTVFEPLLEREQTDSKYYSFRGRDTNTLSCAFSTYASMCGMVPPLLLVPIRHLTPSHCVFCTVHLLMLSAPLRLSAAASTTTEMLLFYTK
ncbi:hypothetical protein DQ04_03051060 [Trypanosoma grayi]|uniref:hypothetical protein n=1 Tax=Trypanosoma grayi TaxID=71804 RepID=UPI0004F3F394|nr:hypothetical protein DQ04_03051060 [Trypanosoma grayi]KEG11022.1 hypothetical protein DQ04_03051060 [Trypanosoma grayi]